MKAASLRAEAPEKGGGALLIPQELGGRGDQLVFLAEGPRPTLTPATSKFIHHGAPTTPSPGPGCPPGRVRKSGRASLCPPALGLGSALGQVRDAQMHTDHGLSAVFPSRDSWSSLHGAPPFMGGTERAQALESGRRLLKRGVPAPPSFLPVAAPLCPPHTRAEGTAPGHGDQTAHQ